MKDWRTEDIRKQIPLVGKCIYFDNSATSLTPEPVLQAMAEYYREYCANVERGSYRLAQTATKKYDAARGKVASLLLHCQPEELIFTRNFTEGANLVAFALEHPLLERTKSGFGYHQGLLKLKAKSNIVATELEHHSNLMPWMRLAKNLGVEFRVITPEKQGLLSVQGLQAKVDENTILVCLQHVSNAIGTVHPLKQLIEAVRGINQKTLIFVDGAQALGHLPVEVPSLGCDFYGFSGHKGPLGPKGTGGLVVKKELLNLFHPFWLGGGTILDVTLTDYKLKDDYRRFDGGSPYIPGLIGLGAAAELLAEIGLEKIRAHELSLIDRLLTGLRGLKGVQIYGPEGLENRTGIVAFNLKHWLCHDVSLTLDEQWNILTRAGHHCCLPTMRFLNILDNYGGNVRISLHFYNTEQEVDTAVASLKKLINRSR